MNMPVRIAAGSADQLAMARCAHDLLTIAINVIDDTPAPGQIAANMDLARHMLGNWIKDATGTMPPGRTIPPWIDWSPT
jgi:hypothetical protein